MLSAKELAEKDIAVGKFLAKRALFAASGQKVLIGILGPYLCEDVGNSALVVYLEDGSRTRILPFFGSDAFQALNLGVEMCRLHLSILISENPEGLFWETGERYGGYDFPANPTPRPLF